MDKKDRLSRGLKINEFVSQLKQYEETFNINWRDLLLDLPAFCQKTMDLLRNNEIPTNSIFGLPRGRCRTCKSVSKKHHVGLLDVDTLDMMKQQIVSIQHILKMLISKCCY